MGNLRKTKTSRRVKRTNTNKRNNTQKQRRLRKHTFRKNRRVNRGGNGTKRTREEEQHEYEQKAMDAEKDENNMKKQKQNMEKNMYRQPLGEGLSEVDEVDQSSQLEITENQNRFNDDMDAEDENNGLWFGGKNKSHNKK
jgi:hypothetical protein